MTLGFSAEQVGRGDGHGHSSWRDEGEVSACPRQLSINLPRSAAWGAGRRVWLCGVSTLLSCRWGEAVHLRPVLAAAGVKASCAFQLVCCSATGSLGPPRSAANHRLYPNASAGRERCSRESRERKRRPHTGTQRVDTAELREAAQRQHRSTRGGRGRSSSRQLRRRQQSPQVSIQACTLHSHQMAMEGKLWTRSNPQQAQQKPPSPAKFLHALPRRRCGAEGWCGCGCSVWSVECRGVDAGTLHDGSACGLQAALLTA